MTDLRSISALGRDSLRGVEPSTVGKKLPKFEWVDPRSLYVEDAYQRSLEGSNSTALIRKIYARFNWARFKPPVCVRLPESGNVLVCIDGQHTATAAATHPGIEKIPVMVVDASDVAARASAFVGHNKDRLHLTQMAVYRAELAAGDPIAEMIDRACRAAGAKILDRSVNLKSKLDAGTTIAVGTIRAVAKRSGQEFLTRVLRLLTRAGRGPIMADEIAAVALILAAADAGLTSVTDAKLLEVVLAKPCEKWRAIAITRAADSGEPTPSALASVWCIELNVRLSGPLYKGGGKSASKRMIETGQAMKAPAPEPAAPPRQPEAPVRQPEEPIRKAEEPVRKPPAPVAIDGKPPQERYVERNGIRFDLVGKTVLHRGREDVLDVESLRFVAALARVMPAFLPPESLAKATFGKAADADFKIRGLVERANKVLPGVQLEVREVPKMGWMLADLAA